MKKGENSKLKKKGIIITLLSCLILIGGFSINYFTKFVDADSTGHPFDLHSIADKTKKIDFTEILETSLKEEGYETVSGMVLEQGKQLSRVTIFISKKEYKGEQTKKRIEKIVNRLAKENEIGSFKVFIETRS
jgi:SAM-dependent MidA family methyltransferase